MDKKRQKKTARFCVLSGIYKKYFLGKKSYLFLNSISVAENVELISKTSYFPKLNATKFSVSYFLIVFE